MNIIGKIGAPLLLLIFISFSTQGQDTTNLTLEGARSNPIKTDIEVIWDEDEAVEHALEQAQPNSVICIFTGRIEAMPSKISRLKEQELNLDISKEDIPNIGLST